jgi:hypothetical protein
VEHSLVSVSRRRDERSHAMHLVVLPISDVHRRRRRARPIGRRRPHVGAATLEPISDPFPIVLRARSECVSPPSGHVSIDPRALVALAAVAETTEPVALLPRWELLPFTLWSSSSKSISRTNTIDRQHSQRNAGDPKRVVSVC